MEGVEGSGKSTQTELLSNWLRRKQVRVICRAEPTQGPIGKLTRDILYKRAEVAEEAVPLLFAADRADDTKRFITPALDSGAIVIVDRYTYSSLAYQGSGMMMPFDLRWLEEINAYAVQPDIVFYLDIDPEVGLGRISGAQRLHDDAFFEDVNRQRRIREAYLRILGLNKQSSILKKLETNGIPAGLLNSVKISMIGRKTLVVGLDSIEPKETVHEQVRAFVEWLVSPRKGSTRRQHLPPPGVTPLSQFSRCNESE
jgi:dTMP kinase